MYTLGIYIYIFLRAILQSIFININIYLYPQEHCWHTHRGYGSRVWLVIYIYINPVSCLHQLQGRGLKRGHLSAMYRAVHYIYWSSRMHACMHAHKTRCMHSRCTPPCTLLLRTRLNLTFAVLWVIYKLYPAAHRREEKRRLPHCMVHVACPTRIILDIIYVIYLLHTIRLLALCIYVWRAPARAIKHLLTASLDPITARPYSIVHRSSHLRHLYVGYLFIYTYLRFIYILFYISSVHCHSAIFLPFWSIYISHSFIVCTPQGHHLYINLYIIHLPSPPFHCAPFWFNNNNNNKFDAFFFWLIYLSFSLLYCLPTHSPFHFPLSIFLLIVLYSTLLYSTVHFMSHPFSRIKDILHRPFHFIYIFDCILLPRTYYTLSTVQYSNSNSILSRS